MTKGQYPSISRGLGNLTPDLWRRLMVLLAEYEKKDRDETSTTRRKAKLTFFLAKLTSAELIADTDNRYYYTWEEVVMVNSNTTEVLEDGRTGSTAINLCEIPNTDENVAPAIDIDGEAYPAGFSLRAIGDCIDEEYIEVVVVMHIFVDTEEGDKQYVFSLANSNDGTCT